VDELLLLLLDFCIEGIGELFLEGGGVFDKKKTRRMPAVIFLVVAGFLLGSLSVWLFPNRILRAGPFFGTSLIITPFLLGAAMELLGTLRGKSRDISHLATWYGGASMGFALAAGRLAVLAFLGRA
jgi:hypothetical protein